jgi:phosphoribosylformylglycinamidine synthase subunit PurS
LIARVVVTPKAVVNDPQGVTVKQALGALGFDEVEDVRVGKYIEVRLDAESDSAAEARVEQMCRKLLANHVIEDYRYTLSRGRQASPTDLESRGRQASPTGPLPQGDDEASGRDSDGAGDPPLPSDADDHAAERTVP